MSASNMKGTDWTAPLPCLERGAQVACFMQESDGKVAGRSVAENQTRSPDEAVHCGKMSQFVAENNA